MALDEDRLNALAPEIRRGIARPPRDARPGRRPGQDGSGPIGALPQSDRFGWLVAPSSTMIQASEVHTGLCEDPSQTLEALFRELVEPQER